MTDDPIIISFLDKDGILAGISRQFINQNVYTSWKDYICYSIGMPQIEITKTRDGSAPKDVINLFIVNIVDILYRYTLPTKLADSIFHALVSIKLYKDDGKVFSCLSRLITYRISQYDTNIFVKPSSCYLIIISLPYLVRLQRRLIIELLRLIEKPEINSAELKLVHFYYHPYVKIQIHIMRESELDHLSKDNLISALFDFIEKNIDNNVDISVDQISINDFFQDIDDKYSFS
jgi:hypothetical protein